MNRYEADSDEIMSFVTNIEEKVMDMATIEGFLHLINSPRGINGAHIESPATMNKADLLKSLMDWDKEQQEAVMKPVIMFQARQILVEGKAQSQLPDLAEADQAPGPPAAAAAAASAAAVETDDPMEVTPPV